MITLEEFLKRWPGRSVDQTTQDEIQLFIDTVIDRSDDYEALVSRLRATGKFKSIFDDFGAANAHRTTNMINRRVIVSGGSNPPIRAAFLLLLLLVNVSRSRAIPGATSPCFHAAGRRGNLRSGKSCNRGR